MGSPVLIFGAQLTTLCPCPAESPHPVALWCSTESSVPSAWLGFSRAVLCRSKCSKQHYRCVWAKPSECGEGDGSALVWPQVPVSLLVPSVPPVLQARWGWV